ncbi:MAG: dephospho-CoA kinase [Rothia sp. (in: high G+C Gram-positive bacteria)]|nr:dephospho-CoA kinase [Rothia sp. (in: high G+C Gram-positive bacteria)]
MNTQEKKLKRIGLTGGIGSGKSTVAQMLVQYGAILVDADAISRRLMEPGSPVLEQIVQTFGQQILNPDGVLSRQQLAGIVFADEAQRQKLNAIVHPAVRVESARLIAEAEKTAVPGSFILEDIPLLVETGQTDRFDGVVVVETSLPVRLRRLVEARGMSEQDARARIAAQASDAQRREVATWVIDNSGGLAATQQQVEDLVIAIKALDN